MSTPTLPDNTGQNITKFSCVGAHEHIACSSRRPLRWNQHKHGHVCLQGLYPHTNGSMSLASRDTTNMHRYKATSQMQMSALPRPARCVSLFFLPQLFLCAPHPCLLLNRCPGNVLGYGLVQRCVHFLWIFIKGSCPVTVSLTFEDFICGRV